MAIVGGVVAPLFIGIAPVHAVGTTLYLIPDTVSVPQDDNVEVTIRLDPGGDSINAVEANLAFDASRLQYISTSFAGSAFSTTSDNISGSGTLKIGRYSLPSDPDYPPVTVDSLVATVTFKALAGSGSTQITFNPSSALDSNTSAEQLDSTAGGTYNFEPSTSPPPPSPPPPPAPDPTPPPSPPPSAGTSGPTKSPTAKPKVETLTPSPNPVVSPTVTTSPSPTVKSTPQEPARVSPANSLMGESVGRKVVLWGLSGLVVVAAVVVGGIIYVRQPHVVLSQVAGPTNAPGTGLPAAGTSAQPASSSGSAGAVNSPRSSSKGLSQAAQATNAFLSRRNPPQVGQIITPQSGAVVTAQLPASDKPSDRPL